MNAFKHISHLVLVLLLLTLNRLLFAGKARVHLKELAITEVTDFQLKWAPLQILFKGFLHF